MDQKEIQSELTRTLNNTFEHPVFSTEDKDIALRCIEVLGQDYTLIYKNKWYQIIVAYNRDIFITAVNLCAADILSNGKKYSEFRMITDNIYEARKIAAATCETIVKVIERQTAEHNSNIEREETIREETRLKFKTKYSRY